MDAVIKVAEGEIGYLEKATNDHLDSKTLNSGKNNYTKYGKAMGCNGQPWCDAFVDWCFIEAYGKDKAEKLLCGFSNYTPTSAQYFKQKGLYATREPQRGDIIFFKNSTRIYHTGIVVDVEGKFVHTIEGNTSAGTEVIPNGGAVCRKTYLKGNSRIAGYGRPNYTKTGEPTLYRGCIGLPVKRLQTMLNQRFPQHMIAVDGDFGANTQNKLIESQAMLGITHDGVCGMQTWRALYG